MHNASVHVFPTPELLCKNQIGLHCLCCGVQSDFALQSNRIAMPIDFDGNDAEDVPKPLPILLPIPQFDLKFLVLVDGCAHASSFVFIGAIVDPRRCLQKSAVSSENFARGVAGELIKSVRGIDDWRVRLLQVAKGQGHGAVDSS